MHIIHLQYNYLLNFAEYDNSVTSPMPRARLVKITPEMAKYSSSVFAINKKLDKFKMITNIIR